MPAADGLPLVVRALVPPGGLTVELVRVEAAVLELLRPPDPLLGVVVRLLGPSLYSIGLQCADLVCAITAAAERGNGQARGYLEALLPRFATRRATGALDGVGIKRFPERARRPREETRLFQP